MSKLNQSSEKQTADHLSSRRIYVIVLLMNLLYVLFFYWIAQTYGNS